HGGPTPKLSDGSIFGFDHNANTLSFSDPHGVQASDRVVVVYDAPGTPDDDGDNPAAILGLVDGRTYTVIVDTTHTLQLGVQFAGGSSVDATLGALRFATPHNLETGDQVVYDCRGTGA